MQEIKSIELNGKKYTVYAISQENGNLALNYTPGDESKILDDIVLIKPHFKSPNHPVWYEIATFDKEFKNMLILARVQVEKA